MQAGTNSPKCSLKDKPFYRTGNSELGMISAKRDEIEECVFMHIFKHLLRSRRLPEVWKLKVQPFEDLKMSF